MLLGLVERSDSKGSSVPPPATQFSSRAVAEASLIHLLSVSRNITVLAILGQTPWSHPTTEGIWDLWTRSSSADIHSAHGWWRGESPIEPALLHSQQQLSSQGWARVHQAGSPFGIWSLSVPGASIPGSFQNYSLSLEPRELGITDDDND